MKLSSALGGLAGACALTILNESVKKIDKNAPHMDLLGMNAVAKLMKGSGIKSLGSGKPEPASVAGDLISNSLYYGMANAGDKNKTMLRGALLGLGAGVGAVALAKPMGMNAEAEMQTTKTKVLTIAWYVIGGLVAAATINLLTKSE
jgi:hypothetical protein